MYCIWYILLLKYFGISATFREKRGIQIIHTDFSYEYVFKINLDVFFKLNINLATKDLNSELSREQVSDGWTDEPQSLWWSSLMVAQLGAEQALSMSGRRSSKNGHWSFSSSAAARKFGYLLLLRQAATADLYLNGYPFEIRSRAFCIRNKRTYYSARRYTVRLYFYMGSCHILSGS